MKPDDILIALQDLTGQERVEFLPLAETRKPSPYPPIEKYLQDLQRSKPETAAEDLLSALWKDVIGVEPTRQVGVSEGFVDFMLPEASGGFVPLELKPLFKFDSKDGSCWRSEANPKNHVAQIRKYLRDNEYVILTDLRTAWFFGALDFYLKEEPFAEKPFTDFLSRCRETRSVLDTVRRLEDTAEKPELEQQFFDDLNKWFNEFEKIKWTPAGLKDESIILLINKLIFARTIEDFGLVPYRYTQDSYIKHTRDWQAKGAHKIVPKFLAEFEEFFDEYYDTEIFSARVWDRLDKDPANLQRFCDKLNLILGINAWDDTFKCGIVHYNYRRIDEDIFGKSYEMFLAANRKDEGIFYTPATITEPMTYSLVDGLFGPLVTQICDAVGAGKADFTTADVLMLQLTCLAIGDTAGGSGGFLIKVLRAVWQQYQRIDQASLWVKNWQNGGDLMDTPPNVQQARAFRDRWNFDNRRVRVAQIMLRHIFAVDKDPGAIEVAKTNLWKEAVKLSTDDYNFRRLTGDINRTLPSLRLNFICADSLVDTDPDKQVAYLSDVCGDAMKKLCALREQYIANPSDHAPLEEALKLQAKLRENLTEHYQNESLPAPPLFAVLSFFPAWFDRDGKARPANERGFDGIIGNPPWENVKPVAKEFAKVGKYSRDRGDFDKWFAKKLKEEPEFALRWKEHQ